MFNAYNYVSKHFYNNDGQDFINYMITDTRKKLSTGDIDEYKVLARLSAKDSYVKELLRKYVVQLLQENSHYPTFTRFPLNETEERTLMEYLLPKVRSHFIK